ncbi:hypothetical protein [Zavarzinella formosa]|uniref:hypothetical protein n=1 Tax=Zavarzinella formosa TaxID=360055 RepID=UPI0002D37D38|nr:hypothetical protein [Zavarzinella formosa]
MIRLFCCIMAIAIAQMFLSSVSFAVEKNPVKIIRQWSGLTNASYPVLGDYRLVTDAKQLEKAWKDLEVMEEVPKVDFANEFVVVVTSRGDRLHLLAKPDEEQGWVIIRGMATAEHYPDTYHVIGTFSREGIKRVNGKELK